MKAIRTPPRILVILAAGAALSNCAAPKVIPPAPQPPPRPAPRPAPPLPVQPLDWRDADQTPGTWLWSVSAGRSSAAFGIPGAAPVATLTCDRAAGQVVLARSGSAGAAVPMQVETTTATYPLMSDPARSASGWIGAGLAPRSPVLDAIAFSRGRFALETAGHPTLYLPSWPELSRVIEDCR